MRLEEVGLGLDRPEDHPEERPDHEHEADDQDDVGSTYADPVRRSRRGRASAGGGGGTWADAAVIGWPPHVVRPEELELEEGDDRDDHEQDVGDRRGVALSGRTAKPCWYMYIVTDSVLSSGPPPVITNGSSNSWR